MMDMSIFLCDEEIFTLLYKYDCSKRIYHLQKVAYYSNLLIDVLAEKYNITDSDRSMLKYGALLHDIGYFINSAKHHKHSKYIILADKLFDKLPLNERTILAILASSHRKKLDDNIKFYPIEKQKKIIKLVSMLRLSDALDYGKDYVIDKAYVENDILYLETNKYIDEEHLKKLCSKSELFKDTFNLQINLSITANKELLKNLEVK